MKKVLLLLALILTLSYCNYTSQLTTDEGLTKIIEAKINSNPKEIDLSTIDDFDYDKLLILEPYSSIGQIEDELHIHLSNINENKIKLSDGINLLVFLKNDKSIKISELDRKNGDFDTYKVIIDRKNAIFEKNVNSKITLKKKK
ncbi:hypothetical protein FA048_14085 [Pedobacter polaris]|uniref:Lipoprotein n=1 Tax=Pedobacter polaris TaxID=2571273 RepID=A0A4U1CRP2_9SPHI|nr:hypothetical protein [Pedobacter polaris]TKC08281.1 hypothetical protein FA048_14085 [Pedobacter polaris]